MWGHDFEREGGARSVAEAMGENFARYGWDYMKVKPRASYHVEGWGVLVHPSGEKYKAPIIEDTPIKSSSDWKRIRPLEPDEGALGEQLQALRLINHAIGFDAYFVQTIFCPLGIAKYLVGNKSEPVLQTIREDRGAMHAALRVITETFATYAIACLEQGASGIFYATNGWAAEGMSCLHRVVLYHLKPLPRTCSLYAARSLDTPWRIGYTLSAELRNTFPVGAGAVRGREGMLASPLVGTLDT